MTQRGILVGLMFVIPIQIMWWHAEALLLVFGQEPELAKTAAM